MRNPYRSTFRSPRFQPTLTFLELMGTFATLVGGLATVALWAGLLYVVCHFISKYW